MRPLHPDVQSALDTGLVIKVGWKRDDPQIRSDAEALWRRLGALPKRVTPEERATEIVTAGYVDGELVAISTAYVTEVALVRKRFAMWRVVVSPEARRHRLMFTMGGYARHVLEEWSLEHPEADVSGMAMVTSDTGLLSIKMPGVLPTSGSMVIGYTPAGARIRVAWFDHARV